MKDLWWTMPGPSSFIERFATKLDEGVNVILVANRLPPGLFHALESQLSHRRITRIELDPEERAVQPVRIIDNRFQLAGSGRLIVDGYAVARALKERGSLLWVNIKEGSSTEDWSRFLNEYSLESRNQQPHERTPVCLVYTGHPSPVLPPSDVTLELVHLTGFVDRIDMLMFTSHLIPKHGSYLIRKLKTHICAELAGSDHELALVLAEVELPELLSPLELLIDYAERMSITSDEKESPESFSTDMIDDRKVAHSAYLAKSNRQNEIQRRIWRAQIVALMPFLEEVRQSLLEAYRDQLRVPHKSRFGVINNLSSLELGHIQEQVQEKVIPYPLERIQPLTRMRNSLAHLSPVQMDILGDPNFLSITNSTDLR